MKKIVILIIAFTVLGVSSLRTQVVGTPYLVPTDDSPAVCIPQYRNILGFFGNSISYSTPFSFFDWNIPLNPTYPNIQSVWGRQAEISFNISTGNQNFRLRGGCCGGNSSPSIFVQLYINNILVWEIETPNDDNTVIGGWPRAYAGTSILASPGGLWSMSSFDDFRHHVRLRLPAVGQITSIRFRFIQSGERGRYGGLPGTDRAAVRVNYLNAYACTW